MSRYKPIASVRTRVFLAGLLWSMVGLMLMVRGYIGLSGSGKEWLLVVAVILGGLKSNFVLDRVAEKNIGRIADKGENRCVGGIYSWRTWLLVLLMITFGRLLRASPLPVWFVGTVYFTVGSALFWSSRKAWTTRVGRERKMAGGS